MRSITALSLICAMGFGCAEAGSEGVVGEAPEITMIAWEATLSCDTGIPSDVEITVSASDAEDSAGALTYSGSVSSCTGTIDAAVSTVTCPNAGDYVGSVTITDTDDNEVSESFGFGPCATGSDTF